MDGVVLERQLQAARYVVHQLFCHKYAERVQTGLMDLQTAHDMYDEAMRNYDGILSGAVAGNSMIANAEEVKRGKRGIDEMLNGH